MGTTGTKNSNGDDVPRESTQYYLGCSQMQGQNGQGHSHTLNHLLCDEPKQAKLRSMEGDLKITSPA